MAPRLPRLAPDTIYGFFLLLSPFQLEQDSQATQRFSLGRCEDQRTNSPEEHSAVFGRNEALPIRHRGRMGSKSHVGSAYQLTVSLRRSSFVLVLVLALVLVEDEGEDEGRGREMPSLYQPVRFCGRMAACFPQQSEILLTRSSLAVGPRAR